MVSFLDIVDNVKGFAKNRRQSKPDSKQPQQHQQSNHLSRQTTWGSVSSTDTMNDIEKIKTNASQLSRKLSRSVTPQYPAGWDTSVRNSRRKRAPPKSRQGSADSTASAQSVQAVASAPAYGNRQPLHMLEEE